MRALPRGRGGSMSKTPDPADAAHATSLGCIALCISLWIRAKTVSQEERGNAERRALFVGLWPAMFWLLGAAAERREQARRPVRRFKLAGSPLLADRLGLRALLLAGRAAFLL